MDHNVIVSDYAAMDRVLKEERAYILNIVKQIKKAGCTVLLVQKSILRDAVSDLALHFLDKIKVMVIKDVEREDIEFVSKVKFKNWVKNENEIYNCYRPWAVVPLPAWTTSHLKTWPVLILLKKCPLEEPTKL